MFDWIDQRQGFLSKLNKGFIFQQFGSKNGTVIFEPCDSFNTSLFDMPLFYDEANGVVPTETFDIIMYFE